MPKIGWRLFGAVLSAVLMVSAFPGNPAPMAVWICLVPWLVALKGCPGAGRAGRAALLPILLSLVFSGLAWMVYLWQPFYEAVILVAPNNGSAMALTAAHLFSYMLPFLVLGGVHHRFGDDSIFAAAALASVHTVVTFVTPSMFVFNLGTFLYGHPLPIQLLDLSGTSLLLWCIVLVNILVRNVVVALWRARFRRLVPAPSLGRNITALAGLLVLVFGYGAIRASETSLQDTASLRIASIQPNMGPRANPRAMVRDSRQGAASSHLELTRMALREHERPDLVVWPENGLAVRCDDPVIQQKISELAAEIEIPIMHQCLDCTSGTESGDCFNQSRYVDQEGVTRFRHNKQNLVPLFEQMPDIPLGSLLRRGETVLVEGAGSPLFEHDEARIIPAVCFDAQSPDLLRRGLERGGQVLVVQSNARMFKRSKIGLFGLAINIASAVAMRVPMVTVSNSGYGAFLQASGRLVPDSITPVFQRGTTVHELILESRTSLYRRFGNWFVYLAGVMAVIGFVVCPAPTLLGRDENPEKAPFPLF